MCRPPCGECESKRLHSRASRIGSSSWLESVAHLENTEEDVNYRNDSSAKRESVNVVEEKIGKMGEDWR